MRRFNLTALLQLFMLGLIVQEAPASHKEEKEKEKEYESPRAERRWVPTRVQRTPLLGRRDLQATPQTLRGPTTAQFSVEPFGGESADLSLLDFESSFDSFNKTLVSALEAQENVSFIHRLAIESRKEDFSADVRKQIDMLLPRVLPAEDLLGADPDDHRRLLSAGKLTPDHPCLKCLHLLIADLQALLKCRETRLIHQPLLTLAEYYRQFMDDLCALETDARLQILTPRVKLSGERLGHYLISQDKARAVLSKDLYGASTRASNKQEGGQSAVYAHGGAHFKAGGSSLSDMNPGMEWAMHAFHRLFMGQGTSPSAFLSLKDVLLKFDPANSSLAEEKNMEAKQAKQAFLEAVVRANPQDRLSSQEFFARHPHYKTFFAKDEKRPDAVQASQTMGDISLYEFLDRVKGGQETLESLDYERFSALVLTSLITVPSDAKDDNLRVVIQGDKKLIVGIDNDRALADMIIADSEGSHYVQGKNVLYLLDEPMRRPVESRVADRVRGMDGPTLMLDWLRALELQNQRYQRLLDQGRIGKQAYEVYFPLKLNWGISVLMLQRLERLQEKLRHKYITHNHLLSALFPAAGLYYQTLRQAHDPHTAQNVLYGQEGGSVSIEQLIGDQVLNDGETVQEALRYETAEAGAYEDMEMRTQSPEQEVSFLLDQLDLKALPSPSRLNVLSRVSRCWPDKRGQAWRGEALAYDVVRNLSNANYPESERIRILHYTMGLSSYSEQGALLHLLASHPALDDVIDEVLTRPVDLEALNQNQFTPLDKAMTLGHETKVLKLIAKGAGIYLQDSILADFIGAQARSAQGFNRESTLNESFNETFQEAFMQLRTRNPQAYWHMALSYFLQSATSSSQARSFEILTLKDGRIIRETKSLSQFHWDQLFEGKSGNLKTVYQTKDRGVALVEGGGEALFFKRYPAFPGVEASVGLLTQRLFPEIGFPTLLAKIKNEPYLISQARGLKGNAKDRLEAYQFTNLAYVLQKTPQTLDQLDPYYLSQSLLMAMLIAPEDGKPNNYVIEPSPRDPSRRRIIGIDNDQAFAPEISRSARGKGAPGPRIKTVLFCLDQMSQAVHPEVRERMLAIDPYALLSGWFEDLVHIHQGQETLFEQKHMISFFEKHNCYLGAPFQKGDAQAIARRLLTMRIALEENPSLSHMELLKKISPFLARHYGKVLGEYRNKTVLERFNELDGKCYSAGASGSLMVHTTLTSSGDLLKARDIPVRKSRKRAIIEGESYDPIMASKELSAYLDKYKKQELMGIIQSGIGNNETILKLLDQDDLADVKKISLSLEGCPVAQQTKILTALRTMSLKSLTLKGASEINKASLNVDKLTFLDLTSSKNLTSDFLPELAEKARSLEYLNLSGIDSIKTIAHGLLGQSYLSFSKLEYMLLNNCSNLQTIWIEAPQLKRFEAKQCVNLKDIIVKADNIDKVDLSHNRSLSKKQIVKFINNHRSLQQINLEGCVGTDLEEERAAQDLKRLAIFLRELQGSIDRRPLNSISSDVSYLASTMTHALVSHPSSLLGELDRLAGLAYDVSALANATNLDLRNNQLTSLPAEFGRLTGLRTLYLHENQLTSLPPEFGKLTGLTNLYLYKNRLTSLPCEFGALTELTILGLQENQLTSLPVELGGLTGLTILNLHENQLTSLPAEFGALTGLTNLILRINQLASLPSEFGGLTNLTILDLNHNQLTSLPVQLGELTGLTELYLHENQLTSFPAEFCGLTGLIKLTLSRNQLTSLPSEFGELTGLTLLHLSNNQLTSLPLEFFRLTGLTILDLNHNRLTSLPSEFGDLTGLTELYLQENQLTSLPTEFNNLTNLTKLNIQFNLLHPTYERSFNLTVRERARARGLNTTASRLQPARTAPQPQQRQNNLSVGQAAGQVVGVGVNVLTGFGVLKF